MLDGILEILYNGWVQVFEGNYESTCELKSTWTGYA